MTDWNLEPSDDDDTLLPGSLLQVLNFLRGLAPEVAPGWPIERGQRAWHDSDNELRRLFGDRMTPLLERRDQIYAHFDALNRALGAPAAVQPIPPEPLMVGRLFAGRKPIHLGTVERYFVYPMSPPLTPKLLQLIVELPSLDDLLVREKHDVFGWHYHYCDQRKRRSDTLMSFDRKRSATSGRANASTPPLCWEPHGVNKAKFQAKPWLWGARKRQTIYTACAPDLTIAPPLTFKPPGKDASDVWPLS